LELSPFQPLERDFAFVVDRTVHATDVLRAAQSADRKLITNVVVFDVYEGEGIEPSKKSIAISVTLQPREKTMTDAEIEAVAGKIVAEVGKRTGGALLGLQVIRALAWAAKQLHHRIRRSLTRLPGAVDSAPTGLMRGLTGQEDAAAHRL